MALIDIEYGSQASSAVHNQNNRFLLSEIQSLASSLETVRTSIMQNITERMASYEASAYAVGAPKITLSNVLQDNEIWLEGAVVSRVTYAALFAVYGTAYGAGNGETTFQLPDFRNRTLWGSDGFGYLEAGLPDITGQITSTTSMLQGSGAFSSVSYGSTYAYTEAGHSNGAVNFNASRSNIIYGRSNTVQPPAVKVRVKTRYK